MKSAKVSVADYKNILLGDNVMVPHTCDFSVTYVSTVIPPNTTSTPQSFGSHMYAACMEELQWEQKSTDPRTFLPLEYEPGFINFLYETVEPAPPVELLTLYGAVLPVVQDDLNCLQTLYPTTSIIAILLQYVNAPM